MSLREHRLDISMNPKIANIKKSPVLKYQRQWCRRMNRQDRHNRQKRDSRLSRCNLNQSKRQKKGNEKSRNRQLSLKKGHYH